MRIIPSRPAVQKAFSRLIAAFAWDLSWAVIGRIVGFNVPERLATWLVGGSPAQLSVVSLRIALALAGGWLIVWLITSLQSTHKSVAKRAQQTLKVSALVGLVCLVAFASFKAGQDRPSLYTITAIYNPFEPLVPPRIDNGTPPHLVITVDSGKLYEYRFDYTLVGECRVKSDDAPADFYNDAHRQQSDVNTITAPMMELKLAFVPGYPLWDKFCKGQADTIQCGILALRANKNTGKYFSRNENIVITGEDRERACKR